MHVQPEECKAISKAVGSVYEPEQVRLLVDVTTISTTALADVCDFQLLSVNGNCIQIFAEEIDAHRPKAVVTCAVDTK